MFHRVWLICLSAVFLSAMTPMSPVLDAATTQQTVKALKGAGLTDVATSSVLRSLEQVLGTGDKEQTYAYREPYSHLAHVDALSGFSGKGCMKAELSIWMPRKPDSQVTLTGMYCRTDRAGAYEWTVVDQAIEGRL